MAKEFKASKELTALQGLINTVIDPITGLGLEDSRAYFDKNTNVYTDVSKELRKILNAALALEEENFDAGKKDEIHLPFIKKMTKLVQRIKESAEQGKHFTSAEIEKIAASFESERHVNKKLRIAGAVLVGMLVIAALAAIAVATFGLATTPFIGAGFAAFSTFMAAAGAKMLATLAAMTGSALGISIVAGSAATFSLTSVIAGLGAKIAGDAKQKRLDSFNYSNLGNNINSLFRKLNQVPVAPAGVKAAATSEVSDAEPLLDTPKMAS